MITGSTVPEKTVMLRGVDRVLWDAVRDQAKYEGMYLRAWIERALRHELEHIRKYEELVEKHKAKGD